MKLAVYEKNGNQDATTRHWQELFADRCKVVTSGAAWVDFVPFGTNKAKGILEFQKRLNIAPEECMVFGDEYNRHRNAEKCALQFCNEPCKARCQKSSSL